MAISKDLLLAILSMDSYNRGYGAGLDHGETQVGLATFAQDTGDLEAQNAGFYAASYTTPEGLVVSYRGTDNPSVFVDESAGGADITAGWVTGGGAWQTDQVRMSQEFFQIATETRNGDPRSGDAIVTGHSLGGGLAGLIAALHGKEALVFDNMPFELAAQSAQDSANPDTLFGVLVREYAQNTF